MPPITKMGATSVVHVLFYFVLVFLFFIVFFLSQNCDIEIVLVIDVHFC